MMIDSAALVVALANEYCIFKKSTHQCIFAVVQTTVLRTKIPHSVVPPDLRVFWRYRYPLNPTQAMCNTMQTERVCTCKIHVPALTMIMVKRRTNLCSRNACARCRSLPFREWARGGTWNTSHFRRYLWAVETMTRKWPDMLLSFYFWGCSCICLRAIIEKAISSRCKKSVC